MTAFIRRAVEDFRREGVVVGLSGGIDSLVVAVLAARALGVERVLGLILPERDSVPESKRLALQLVRSLGIRCQTVCLTLPLAVLGVYRLAPLWLIPGSRLKANLILRYYRQFRETLPKGESSLSTVPPRQTSCPV